MSWQAMMCRHVLYNSVGLFVTFGILLWMVIHLWLWRRRCAPQSPWGGYRSEGFYYAPFGLPKAESGPTTRVARTDGESKTRLSVIVNGMTMKMPACGDPIMEIPSQAFHRLLVSPNWLTPDKYPTSVGLVKGELGCLLSHDGAVRVRVRKARDEEEPRSISDRVNKLTHSFLASGHLPKSALVSSYSMLVRDWIDRGCPDLY